MMAEVLLSQKAVSTDGRGRQKWLLRVYTTQIVGGVVVYQRRIMDSVSKAIVDASQRTTDDGQKAITKAHDEHIVLRPTRQFCSKLTGRSVTFRKDGSTRDGPL
ncbi:hypothetical protein DPMN_119852 [Dreissena polymorpha]|uniref:Uncharacterized protein n=1 Tax=Dreissena polymorpha TaxID=45954 RepID=A0A9D4GIV3_DREPO|nr:hypothetical protein DPMN_119852 [Dreissena polymorpha]